MAKARVITPQEVDFPRWYQDVLTKAELAENGPVRGTMVIRPYGYGIWERMQAEVDLRIKAAGAGNAYFPLLIPEELLRKEAEHVEGFTPELAVVTHAGGRDLEEPVVVRPTSETIINSYFSRWIQSYRDLPLLVNQWANVVRWELRPRIFLRTTEFLWQEGHTAHATEDEARAYALQILHEVYRQFMVDVLAIPVIAGIKTPRERFAGAVNTASCEAMMRDSKALQMGTSHELGQNFARAFNITYLDDTGAEQYAWQTSWGASTRMVGGLIMCHGDDAGLRLPPSIAPTQVVVMLVRDQDGAGEVARKLVNQLESAGHRVRLDDRVEQSFGRRAVDSELKGVPLRIEVGPRDLAEGRVTIVRRDTLTKLPTPVGEAGTVATTTLDKMHSSLLAEATEFRDARIHDVSTLGEVGEATAAGWARLPYDIVGEDGETSLAESAITIRCLTRPDGTCPETVDEEGLIAYAARAY
ncbi:MAG: proline--tRNA ligase [Actinobacteria bacterium]|nr:MAG: proline--tRNA ligase [Actinomycetota bacterium]